MNSAVAWLDGLDVDVLANTPTSCPVACVSSGDSSGVVVKPKLLLFDEPTTAADILVERKVLHQSAVYNRSLDFQHCLLATICLWCASL